MGISAPMVMPAREWVAHEMAVCVPLDVGGDALLPTEVALVPLGHGATHPQVPVRGGQVMAVHGGIPVGDVLAFALPLTIASDPDGTAVAAAACVKGAGAVRPRELGVGVLDHGMAREDVANNLLLVPYHPAHLAAVELADVRPCGAPLGFVAAKAQALLAVERQRPHGGVSCVCEAP